MEPERDEDIVFHGRPSWRSMVGFYVKGLLLVLLAGVLGGLSTRLTAGHVQAGWIAVVVSFGFVLVLALGVAARIRTTYTITNRRLTIETGILRRELHETRLERVQNVGTSQTLPERMLRVGTVDFDTAGEAGFDFSFRGVSEPRRIVRKVDQAIAELPGRVGGP